MSIQIYKFIGDLYGKTIPKPWLDELVNKTTKKFKKCRSKLHMIKRNEAEVWAISSQFALKWAIMSTFRNPSYKIKSWATESFSHPWTYFLHCSTQSWVALAESKPNISFLIVTTTWRKVFQIGWIWFYMEKTASWNSSYPCLLYQFSNKIYLQSMRKHIISRLYNTHDTMYGLKNLDAPDRLLHGHNVCFKVSGVVSFFFYHDFFLLEQNLINKWKAQAVTTYIRRLVIMRKLCKYEKWTLRLELYLETNPDQHLQDVISLHLVILKQSKNKGQFAFSNLTIRTFKSIQDNSM